MILDPKRPWLIQYLLVKGFETVPTWEELESDEFALTILGNCKKSLGSGKHGSMMLFGNAIAGSSCRTSRN